ncbi:DUF1906 domain-containing protein [Corynebacterium aquilae]|uniref:DUF1906 domain-containing protein n=1 Tax=Corynebacterium aquilae TaxID=203263 RepID=UPI0009525C69|nr:DUF1906 domain-containing protein [Corynebacterium aquilae]
MAITRRHFLLSTLALAGATTIGAAPAHARPVIGKVLDYSAGVPSGRAVAAAGYIGAVRYVSTARPGAAWMLGKPVRRTETNDFAANKLSIASVYQFGVGPTADWRAGAAGAAQHVPQAIALHRAAGGPINRPIYMAIDDNPTRAQYLQQIKPFLVASQTALAAAGYQLGVYGNYNVVDWCVNDGIGQFYWMHDWGSQGRIHPRANIHQLPQNRQVTVDGITCDVNDVFTRDWGQWSPGVVAPRVPETHTDTTIEQPIYNPELTAPLGDALGLNPEEQQALNELGPLLGKLAGGGSSLSS